MSDGDAYPEALRRLVAYFKRLPGIGGRTASRLALALLDWPDELLQAFGQELASLRENVKWCTTCGNLADTDTCRICRSADRDRTQICVVEVATQIPVFESSGSYRGLYHVLGGRLQPLEGVGPDDLRVQELRDRLTGGEVEELILATSPDVEGEATAHYLAAEFAVAGVRITRIAAGVPVGADLSYADAATMARALAGRRALD
jgi:recombination protein RecR